MRKIYPYLQEQYLPNLNTEQEKRNFLAQLDDFVNQRQYVQITLLDWKENPLKEIQGVLTSGGISKDGASSVRRTCSFGCTVDGGAYSVDDLKLDFALNKKVFIEIGILNETDQFKDYPILWFPQGVFIIAGFSMNSSSNSAVNLNISLKDKMCLLNGDIGGKFPAVIQFDTVETQKRTGEEVIQKVLIYNIILELVHHWGKEDLNNIIIEDVPLRIREIVKWDGTESVYTNVPIEISTESNQNIIFTTTEPDKNSANSWYEYESGADVGYIYSDLILTEELVANAGDSVCSILDKIKNRLGNYEYFYDEMGIFIFREIKNYLNITQAEKVDESMTSNNAASQNSNTNKKQIKINEGTFLLDESSENQYLIETTNSKTLYSFSDDKNVTSITVTPQYDNIKNDYIIQGVQSTTSDVKKVVRYRLAIDDLPQPIGQTDDGENYYGVYPDSEDSDNRVLITYTDPIDNLNKIGFAVEMELPEVGNMDTIYYSGKDAFIYDYPSFTKLYYIAEEDKHKTDAVQQPVNVYSKSEPYIIKDWRTYLYVQGLYASLNGLETNDYFSDLVSFWPTIYDVEKQKFIGEESNEEIHHQTLTDGIFYLDFIDAASSVLGKYSVNAIGRRQQVTVDEKINCLFEPEIPNVIFLNKDNPDENWSDNTALDDDNTNTKDWTPTEKLAAQRQECIDNLQPWTQVDQQFYSQLSLGGYKNSAYNQLRYELFCHTRYQQTVSLTALPVYYLEPNSRVYLSSYSTNTYGDFMVQNVNLTLGPGANMSVVLNEVAERL